MIHQCLRGFEINDVNFIHTFNNDTDSTYIIDDKEVILYEVNHCGDVYEYLADGVKKQIGRFVFDKYPNWVFVPEQSDENKIVFDKTNTELLVIEYFFFKKYIENKVSKGFSH